MPLARDKGSQNKISNGLGLYISKRIMECLNGTLEVKSIQGVKTVFKIYLEAQLLKGDLVVSFI